MIYNTRLKQLREDDELKQKDVAKAIDIERTLYVHYENEHYIMPIKHLNSVANFFKVSIDYLFGFAYNKNYKDARESIDLELSAQRLKKFRKDNKLTQEKLAKELNTDRTTISKYEVALIPIATPYLYMICKKYKVSADYLLGKID